jgi:hypothetical protein
MWKVMVADDEPFIREGLKKLIEWENLGYELVGLYKDGRALLNEIDEKSPDVVILDIQMPVLNGLETAKIIHDKYSNVLVIILTAYSDFEYAKKAIEYQVKKYILKSSLLEDLPMALEDIKKDLTNKLEDTDSSIDVKNETELIQNTKRFIEENYSERLTLEDIANEVHVNKAYLSRTFKAQTGENLFEYINRLKIKKAKIYIKKYNKKIYEVAQLLGFEDTAYFSRIFKKYEGISPKEYEKKVKF